MAERFYKYRERHWFEQWHWTEVRERENLDKEFSWFTQNALDLASRKLEV